MCMFNVSQCLIPSCRHCDDPEVRNIFGHDTNARDTVFYLFWPFQQLVKSLNMPGISPSSCEQQKSRRIDTFLRLVSFFRPANQLTGAEISWRGSLLIQTSKLICNTSDGLKRSRSSLVDSIVSCRMLSNNLGRCEKMIVDSNQLL